MRSRSSRGSTSSKNNPVNEDSVTVARSEPEPLTHRMRAGRPRKSISSDLAEVLPPPQLQTERSAPSLRERATNCDSVVGVEIFAMTNISTPTTLSQLVARSRKLGADRSVCNWGGGNTSAKSDEIDFRGRPARILWVKGSGSDLATVTEASFTGLFLEDVLPLLERERVSDSEMVDYLAHCFYEPGRPRPSIETFLHGFLPFTHIDHTHADATNYFACAANGEELARDCFGNDLIWIPYRRPGYALAREVALAVRASPTAKLVILAKHGLITWGETDGNCYTSTLATVTRARDYVESRIARADRSHFGGTRVSARSA